MKTVALRILVALVVVLISGLTPGIAAIDNVTVWNSTHTQAQIEAALVNGYASESAAIDDVVVWNSARSQAQIEETLVNGYASTTGMQTWWKFNNTGDLIYDTITSNTQGIIKGTPSSLSTPTPNDASDLAAGGFTSTDNWLVANTTKGSYATWSCEMWVRNPQLSSTAAVVWAISSSENGGGDDDIRRLWVNADGSMTMGDRGYYTGIQNYTTDPLTWENDKWYQITVVQTYTSGDYHNIKVYRGAKGNTSVTKILDYGTSSFGGPYWMSVGAHPGGYYGNNQGKGGYLGGGPEANPDLQMWWAFDDAGNIIYDKKSGATKGVVKGSPTSIATATPFDLTGRAASGFTSADNWLVADVWPTVAGIADYYRAQTYELWVRNPQLSGTPAVLWSLTGSENGGGDDDMKRLWVNADGSLTMGDRGYYHGMINHTSAPLSWQPDKWYQITVTQGMVVGDTHSVKVYRGAQGGTSVTEVLNYESSSFGSGNSWLSIGAHPVGYYGANQGKGGYSGNDTVSVITPVITPPGGQITGPTQVTITCGTTGATIHYTTDGTNPTGASPVYTAPITVSFTACGTTVKAIAIWGSVSSAIASQTYVGERNCSVRDLLDEATFKTSLAGTGGATPWYSAVNDNNMAAGNSTWAGNYCFWPSVYLDGMDWGGMTQWSWTTAKSITEVSFYRVTPGYGWYDPAKVMVDYQNLDGTWTRVLGGPTGNWIPVTWTNTNRWGNPTDRVFTVAVNVPVAVGVKLYIGYPGSWAAVEEVEVIGTDADALVWPEISPAGGHITGPTQVTIACGTYGSTIHYTTDGTDPTSSSPVYTAPITVLDTACTTVKAISVKGAATSGISSETYTGALNCIVRDILDEATFKGSLGGTGYAVPWYSAINDNSMAGGDSTWAGNAYFSEYLDGMDWGGMTQWSWTTAKSINSVSFYRVTPGWGWVDPAKVMIDYQNIDGTWARVSGGPTGNWIPVTWTNTNRWGNASHRVFTVTVNVPVAKGIKLWIGNTGTWAAVEEVEVMGADVDAFMWPEMNPAGGNIAGATQVSITHPDPAAVIRYTTNGTDPTGASPVYTAPITVDGCSTTLKAIAIKGAVTSGVSAETYTLKMPVPVMNPAASSMTAATPVTITCSTSGATIRYTTDGTEPTSGSTPYTVPVTATDNMTIKAKVFKYTCSSDTASAYYYIPNPLTIAYSDSIVVDGNLSEWSPSDFVTIDRKYYEPDPIGYPISITEAKYAAKWGNNGNKVYVAVKVNDPQQFLSDEFVSWDGQDDVEIYLHAPGDTLPADYSTRQQTAQQFMFGIMDSNRSDSWAVMGGHILAPASVSVTHAVSTSGTWLYYEVALTPWQYYDGISGTGIENPTPSSVPYTLKNGDYLGLDVIVFDRLSIFDYAGMLSENELGGKSFDYRQFAKHLLTGGITYQPMSLAGAKNAAVGTQVEISSGVVSAALTDYFYVETTDRSSGIRVNKTAHGLAKNQIITKVTGEIKTVADTGEKYIQAVDTLASGTSVISPLGSNSRGLAGSGLSATGLLVKAWGKVTSLGSGIYKIDDGSGLDLRFQIVSGSFTVNPAKAYAVTGPLSLYKVLPTGPVVKLIIVKDAATDIAAF